MPSMVWKGYISFGLVSFPVELLAAGRAEAVHFHLLHKKDNSRVKEMIYCAEENRPIERSEIVKGYEVGEGEYIVIDPEDLKAIAPATASTMDIIQFVREADVDPLYFERSYYVAPGDEMGKPYVLFVKALRETKYSAIAKLSMHSREHVVLIRTTGDNLILHTLFYADELHPANKPERKEPTASTPKELQLAVALIRQLAAPFEPQQFHDTYRENVEKMIEDKRKGKKISVVSKQSQRAPVIDLAEALRKSLKSPVESPAKPKPVRRHKVA